MTVMEAYKIFRSKWGNIEVCKCIEYKTLFVFVLGKDSTSTLGMASVSKRSGVVQKFMPDDISLSEYRAGKEIKMNKRGQKHE